MIESTSSFGAQFISWHEGECHIILLGNLLLVLSMELVLLQGILKTRVDNDLSSFCLPELLFPADWVSSRS